MAQPTSPMTSAPAADVPVAPGGFSAVPLPAAPTEAAQRNEELRDIHLPDGVSFWPPAPGWLGLGLLLVLATLLLRFIGRRRGRPSLVREAKQALGGALAQPDHHTQALKLVEVLRRVGASHPSACAAPQPDDVHWSAWLAAEVGLPAPSDACAALVARLPYERPDAALPMPAFEELVEFASSVVSRLPRAWPEDSRG